MDAGSRVLNSPRECARGQATWCDSTAWHLNRMAGNRLREGLLANRKFSLLGRVRTSNLRGVKQALLELVPEDSITQTEEGFLVKAELGGASARELNRTLLSALRRIEKKTALHAEWTSDGMTERFFDYVPKGIRQD